MRRIPSHCSPHNLVATFRIRALARYTLELVQRLERGSLVEADVSAEEVRQPLGDLVRREHGDRHAKDKVELFERLRVSMALS